MRITIIGSGNVATHLAAAFKNAGHRVVQVYSPNIHNAALLAYHVGADGIGSLKDINVETDIIVVAIKDDAIKEIIPSLLPYGKLVVHTSGAVGLQALTDHTANAGVFYPLQTFSKTKELNFGDVPMCIEGADETITKQLEELARTISNNVYRVNSAQRKILHLSAVFACNFTNHLYAVAEGLLKEHDMPFDMLRPLILETADKIKAHSPATVQTGPAARKDEQTMQAHLNMLEGREDLQQIYLLLSQDIIKNSNVPHGDK
ncbi:Rossmann-like and DUF2520 domain-containing protein [Mucilaginibacter psychrotolerans]|uniref:DUF2520 domain-containing protein n=1 Tax=Mucilaginibacter psychrotolerans TaxID=1524096 RepID=A0A4Y8S5J4_9SPHI|nr:Rossmann-like and DUF2520 domain-containing protein [Mucilaginibacter psychrotolerans]TFF33747.1 DUF2520 domain-containing protein [Mucilaginibacter psychrotolerans]